MRTPDLDPDLLRCFLAVAETGGFTTAGERIGLSQSAVSVKIKRLEDLLGRRLFRRTSRSLELTESGELLIGLARRLLALNEETYRRVTAPPIEGELRLGVAEYFAPQHLAGLLATFASAYPRVRLEIRTGMSGDLLAAFDGGALDLVIAKRDPGLHGGRLIARDPLLWVAAEERLAKVRVLPLLTLPPPCAYRVAALAALDRIGRPWEIRLTSASIMGVQAAVTAGLGVGTLGRAALLPGMVVLGPETGLPPLEDIEVAIWGEERTPQALVGPLAAMISRAIELPAARAA